MRTMRNFFVHRTRKEMSERKTIQQLFDPKRNNLTMLRFVFASLVIFSHTYAFVMPEFEPLASVSNGTITFGTFAVSAFFILSGFLITRSYERSHSFIKYCINRFLRIYPGYWVCLIITGFVLTPCVSLIREGSLESWKTIEVNTSLGYIYNNATIKVVQRVIGDKPPYLMSNNSLWTLFYEVMCYCAIGVLGIVGVVKKKRIVIPLIWCVLVLLLLFGHYYHVPDILFSSWKMTLYRLTSCFFAGATFYLFAEKIKVYPIVAVCMAILYMLSVPLCLTEITDSLLLAYPLLLIGFGKKFSWLDAVGDFSYGIYIYGFPIQIIVAGLMPKSGVIPFFLASFAGTLLFAVMSYQFIERPFLSLKRH